MSEMLKIYLYSNFGYYVRKGDIEEKDFRGFFQKEKTKNLDWWFSQTEKKDLFSYS